MSEKNKTDNWREMLVGEPEKHPWRPGAILFGGLLFGIAFVWLGSHFVDALKAGTDDDDPKYEGIRNLGLILIAIIGAPFVLYRTWVLGRQAKTAETQAQLAEDRNFTDLFTKAVEQLGADKVVKRHAKDRDGNLAYDEHGVPVMSETTEPNLEVRLGAIYALQRISRASEKDHIPVMATLCAYIRENAIGGEPDVFPLRVITSRDYDENIDEYLELIEIHAENIREYYAPVKILRSDIRSALSVISQRSEDLRTLERLQGFHLDFRRANFQRADFAGVDFREADLSESFLQGANFSDARMERVNLNQANISGADLQRAQISGGTLNSVYMNGSNLADAKLDEVNLYSAISYGANFHHVDLTDANLKFTSLAGANFSGTELRGTNFSGSDWTGVKLTLASLREVNVSNVNFDLVRANNTDISDLVSLNQDDLDRLFGCNGTKIPTPLTRPNHWYQGVLSAEWDQDVAYRYWVTQRKKLKKPPFAEFVIDELFVNE